MRRMETEEMRFLTAVAGYRITTTNVMKILEKDWE